MRPVQTVLSFPLLLLIACSSLVACATGPDDPGGGESAMVDEEMYDGDGDGVADTLGRAVDIEHDGVIDEFDFHGDGSITGPGVDTDQDGSPNAIGWDMDDDEVIDALDTDGDGEVDRFADD